MNEIVINNSNGTLTVSSLQVAEDFGKQHKNVIQTIENLMAENSATKSFYKISTHINRGKEYKAYEMTRDGFSLLVMGFTGAKALEWKLKYIQAFNEMEKALREPKTKTVKANEDKEKALEVRMMNAKTRFMKAKTEQAKFMLECAKIDCLSEVSKSAIIAKAVELATGEQLIALPEVEKTYTATEVGDMFGVSANKIGRVAKAYNLKTKEYGIEVLDSAKYTAGKQVPSFRYNEKAISEFRKIFKM